MSPPRARASTPVRTSAGLPQSAEHLLDLNLSRLRPGLPPPRGASKSTPEEMIVAASIVPIVERDRELAAHDFTAFRRRPILNGYSGYRPTGFVERTALVSALPDREALRRLREEVGLDTIGPTMAVPHVWLACSGKVPELLRMELGSRTGDPGGGWGDGGVRGRPSPRPRDRSGAVTALRSRCLAFGGDTNPV